MNINTLKNHENLDPINTKESELARLPDAKKAEIWAKFDEKKEAIDKAQENIAQSSVVRRLLWQTNNNKDFWTEVSKINDNNSPLYNDINMYIKATRNITINQDKLVKLLKEDPYLRMGMKDSYLGEDKDLSLTTIYQEIEKICKNYLDNNLSADIWFAGLKKNAPSYQSLYSLDFIKNQSEYGKIRKQSIDEYIQSPIGKDILSDDNTFRSSIKKELSIDRQDPKQAKLLSLILTLCKQPGNTESDIEKRLKENNTVISSIKLYDLPSEAIWLAKKEYPWADVTTNGDTTYIMYTLASIRTYLLSQKRNHYKNNFENNTITWSGSSTEQLKNIQINNRDYMTQEYLWWKIFNDKTNLLFSGEAGKLQELQINNKETLREWNKSLATYNQFKLSPIPNTGIDLEKSANNEWTLLNWNKRVNDINDIVIMNDGYRRWALYALEKKDWDKYTLYSYFNMGYKTDDYQTTNFRNAWGTQNRNI